jgi:hypothetical protein
MRILKDAYIIGFIAAFICCNAYGVNQQFLQDKSRKKTKRIKKLIATRNFQELQPKSLLITIKTYDNESGGLLHQVIQEYDDQGQYYEYDIDSESDISEDEEPVFSISDSKSSVDIKPMETGLFNAIEEDDIEQARFFTLLHISLDYQRPCDGQTCLMVAVNTPHNKNWYNFVKLFLEKGASIAPVDKYGKTVLDSVYLKTDEQDPLPTLFQENVVILKQKLQDRASIKQLLDNAQHLQQK